LFYCFSDFTKIESKACRDNFLASLIIDRNKRNLKE